MAMNFERIKAMLSAVKNVGSVDGYVGAHKAIIVQIFAFLVFVALTFRR